MSSRWQKAEWLQNGSEEPVVVVKWASALDDA